jgi:hypothetical protein
MFTSSDGYLSVCIYRNINHGMVYYDTVIYRKIRLKNWGGSKYQRGANLKMKDLPILIDLLKVADEYFRENIKTAEPRALPR